MYIVGLRKNNSKQKTHDRNQYNNRGEIESLLPREEKKIHYRFDVAAASADMISTRDIFLEV